MASLMLVEVGENCIYPACSSKIHTFKQKFLIVGSADSSFFQWTM